MPRASAEEAGLTLLAPEAPGITARRDSLRRRALAGADVLGFCVSYSVALLVLAPTEAAFFTPLPALVLAVWLVINKAMRQYDRDVNLLRASTLDEIPKVIESVLLAAGLLFMLAPISDVDFAQAQAAAFAMTGTLVLLAGRGAARYLVRRALAPERILVIGSGYVCDLVARKIARRPFFGAEVTGFVDTTDSSRPPLSGEAAVSRLGSLEEFEAICEEHGIERAIVAFTASDHESLIDVVRRSKRLGVKVSIVPRLYEVCGTSVELDNVEGVTLLGVRPVLRTSSTLRLKRGLDIAGASLGLLVAAPVLLTAAVAIKMTSSGPVFYRQDRVGRGNQRFSMLKLRTMVDGAHAMRAELAAFNEVPGGTLFKMEADPRVTPVGRFLRRTSIDELPQLWNVLRGEMSLVGPRPLIPEEDTAVLGWHRARLDLTPGLTGPWQVLGRNAIPFDEMVRIDYLYVAEWSLWNDLKLLVRTLPIVFGQRGC